MLGKVAPDIVNESLDWFFKSVLKDIYNSRRQVLMSKNEKSIPSIDFIIRNYIDDSLQYPPETATSWNRYFNKAGSEKNPTRLRTKDKQELASLDTALSKLMRISKNHDFPNSVIHLATGLWAVDNEETNLVVSSLSNPSVNLSRYFGSSRELIGIIIDSLVISHQSRMALYMSKILRYDDWDEKYDALYASLLVSSGQLVEALKYQRMFSEQENYHQVLQHFFELCSTYNVTKSLNCLNLSVEEEEVLNQHMMYDSRPVTPSGTKIKHVSSAKPKPRHRNIQVVQRTPSFNDSPARNTRSARKKKTTK